MRHERKKRAPDGRNYHLTLYGRDMSVLYAGRLDNLPLPESMILACSEEFFNDPAPCEIHRRAVALRLYGEIIEALPLNETLAIAQVPPQVCLSLRELNPAYARLDMKSGGA